MLPSGSVPVVSIGLDDRAVRAEDGSVSSIGRMIVIPFLAAGLLSGSASGIAAAAPSCFWPSAVSGFSEAGPDTALVRVGACQVWELTLSPGCPDVDWALSIAIRARSGQAICPGRRAELILPDPSGRGLRACLVRSVRRLNRAEAAAAIDRPACAR